MVSVPRTRLLLASPIGRVRPSRSICTSKSAIVGRSGWPPEMDVLGQAGAGQRLPDAVVADVGDLSQTIEERSEEHTSELQSLMRISYAAFCLKKKTIQSGASDTHPKQSHECTSHLNS